MEEWKEYKLSQICSLSAGGDAPRNYSKFPLNDNIFPVFSNGEKDYGLYGYTNYFVIKAPAVTISARGNIGLVCYRKDNFVPIVRLITAKAKEDLISNEFLYYYLKNTYIWGDGSVQKQLTVPMISGYKVNVPPKNTQHIIVNILKSLDDKIENNRMINENLEQQAQALFKSWFVDFEPFRDQPFVESELGMIPQGWKVVELGSVIQSIKDKVGDRTDVKVLSPITTGELVLSEDFFSKQVYSKSIAKYILVRPNDFAYNPARVNIGSLGMNTYNFYGCVSPVYVVLRCEEGYEQFFNFLRKRDSFKKEVFSRAIGGVRQTLSYTDFSLIKTIYPPREIVESFNIIINKFNTIIIELKKQIEILSKLRDILLPKLMSGEIKV